MKKKDTTTCCQCNTKSIDNFTLEETFRSSFQKFDGSDNAHWDVFFVHQPAVCSSILFAQTTMQHQHIIDSFWNKYFGKNIFYNIFLCEESVVIYTYDKKLNILKEEILCFEDVEFLKKLPKFSQDIYKKILEVFLEFAKEKVKNSKRVVLYFDAYKIQLAKYEFLVWKDEELFIKNFFKDVEYHELGDIIINAHTNKRIRFDAPKIVYDFFLFYIQVRDKHKTSNEKDILYAENAVLFAEGIGISVISLSVLFGLLAFILYIEAHMFQELLFIHYFIATAVSIAIAETVAAYLDRQSK